MGKVVLVCSGKGGTGKTTLAVNLGASLAKRAAKTLILDMNMGLRNDDIYLGLENSMLFDLGDVVSGMCNLEKAIVKHDMIRNLSLLSCPQYREIDGLCASHIRALYAKLKKDYDIVIVDCPVSQSMTLVNLSSGADEAILVTTQDYTSLRNTDAVNKKLAAQGILKRYHVINMVSQETYNNENLPDMMIIQKTLQTEALGAIPYDQNIHLQNNQGSPASLLSNSYLSRTFDEMAYKVL